MTLPLDYADDTTKSRRLALLRVILENEGAANRSLIKVALNQLGFRGRLATEEAIDKDVEFLKTAGLVTVEWYRNIVQTVVIAKRGQSFLRREVEPIEGLDYPDIR